MTTNIRDIEQALQQALPSDFRGDTKRLAELLYQVVTNELTVESFEHTVNAEPLVSAPIVELTDKDIVLPNAVISFGSSNQTGEVRVGDVAGRDVNYTLNLHFNQSKSQPQQAHSPRIPVFWQMVQQKWGVGVIALAIIALVMLIFYAQRQYAAYRSSPQYVLSWTTATTTALLVPNAQSKTIMLDAFDSNNTRDVGPISSTMVLENQQRYRVTISGTWSTWHPSWWASLCKGVPEAKPQYESPGRPNGNVGADAAYVFARPQRSQLCGQQETLPVLASGQLPLRMKFNPNDVEGQLLVPDVQVYQPSHVYVYTVIGEGYPVELYIRDDATSENYGILKIRIDGPLK